MIPGGWLQVIIGLYMVERGYRVSCECYSNLCIAVNATVTSVLLGILKLPMYYWEYYSNLCNAGNPTVNSVLLVFLQ